MDLRRFIGRLLAVLAVAGLALASVAGPAAVHAASLGGPTYMSMSADMSCCPDEQKSKDCQDCPLIVMCILTTAQAALAPAVALPLRHPVRTMHSFRDDILLAGLDRPPPDQPPRSLV